MRISMFALNHRRTHTARTEWDRRMAAPIYARMSQEFKPEKIVFAKVRKPIKSAHGCFAS
jgi:hypothetical protein